MYSMFCFKKSHLFPVLRFQHEPRLFAVVSMVNLQHCSQQISQSTEVALPKTFILLLVSVSHINYTAIFKSYCATNFEQQNFVEK